MILGENDGTINSRSNAGSETIGSTLQ